MRRPGLAFTLLLGCLALLPAVQPARADGVFSMAAGPPAGFEDLSAAQTTQADVYYGGEFLATVFVDFDPYQVTIHDPLSAVELIPNLKDPEKIASVLSGPLPTHAEQLCNSRNRENCGQLYPPQAAVIFDESRYRLTLFVHPAELLVHKIQHDKYLPAPGSGVSGLHNIRMNASGSGSDRRYSLSSESFVAHKQARVRSRYGLTDSGAALYELAWQKDGLDVEYEVGSFRTRSSNLSFASDVDVLGFRVASSTKARTDLDHALGTPVLLFLAERSRVDVYRGNELLDSRFYPAGNQQLDTSNLPDGAYDITLYFEDAGGNVRTQTQFFVRSGQMPPMDEPQYYVEGGTLLENLERGVPELAPGGWLRGGSSHRLRENLSWDNEALFANRQMALQSGLFWLQPGWHLYSGAMLTNDSNAGIILRGGWQRDGIYTSFDLRHVSDNNDEVALGEYSITRGGYTQATANIGFPVRGGQLYLRGRFNNRYGVEEKDFGFSYLGNLLSRSGMTADLVIDGGVGDEDNWIRAGISIRWQRQRGRSATLHPRLRTEGSGVDPELSGRWQSPREVWGLGDVTQALYAEHTEQRSAVGARYTPRELRHADFEVGYQRSRLQSDLFYAVNNRFSMVNSREGTTFGDGGSSAGAVIVKINGNFNGRFAVLVGNRVVGHAWVGRPNVISLRPYERYDVRVKPLGDRIVGYDQAPQQVTLYPGNVQTLEFSANELTVVIGQALAEDGTPLARARFSNVEGYGATDELGWFQVEMAHDEPLQLQRGDGGMCELSLPPADRVRNQDGLRVLEPLPCRPIQAQR